jgi:hypothetical protein
MKAMFSSVVALVLLVGYIGLLIIASLVIDCSATEGCKSYPLAYFNDNMSQALSVIGGLISALVVAELAITKPGEPPVARVLSENATDRAKNVLRFVTGAYIIIWLLAGIYTFYISLFYPKALLTVTAIGQSWLGLAVASSYAYFGLQQR